MAILFLVMLIILSGCTNAPQQACTEEAKICPYGDAVGRTGPNCEFAPCIDKAQLMTNAD